VAGKNELIEIKMRLIGARQVAEEGERAGKGVRSVGKGAAYTGRESTRLGRATSALGRTFSRLGRAAKYGFGILAVTGAFALKSAIEKTTELSKTTIGLHRNLGLSSKAASRWGAVAQARDIDTKALNTTFAILSSKAVEAARKGGTLLTPFHQLGISQRELNKHTGKFNWLLMRTAKALGDEKGGTVRMAAAKALLGKGYQAILPLFAEGTKGLKEQLHWADKYGVTLDGKTNNSIMKFVQAQRQSKMAMLGLQLGLAKTLMPTLTDAEGEFQQFVRILNSDLTTEQKINHVGAMFEKLEGTLIQVITDALPKVAENGGKLGVALAGAVWTGFKNSGLVGKLVITAWLLKFMGGGGLIKSVAGGAGKAIALGLLKVLMPTLAAELAAEGSLGALLRSKWSGLGGTSGKAFSRGFVIGLIIGIPLALATVWTQLSHKTKESIGHWGMEAGRWFTNTLIDVVNVGISGINAALNAGNPLGAFGVHAPQIPEVGEVGAPGSGRVRGGPGPPPAPNGPPGAPTVNGPPGTHVGPHGEIITPHHKHHGGRRPLVLQLNVDGKTLAERTVHAAELDAALA
jgi:hypothetical protein